MAGAWENGEIEVGYRPLVAAADGSVRGVEARLRWNHPAEGVLPHETCVRLAGETGLALPLGTWLLRTAAERVAAAGVGVPLTVELTAHQAADPELVGEIRDVLESTGLAPERLSTRVPVGDVAGGLRRRGGQPQGTGGNRRGRGDPRLRRRDLPDRVPGARGPRGAPARGAPGSPAVDRTLTALVEAAHLAGAEVAVTGIDHADQREWWRDRGADRLSGPLFTEVPGGLPGR